MRSDSLPHVGTFSDIQDIRSILTFVDDAVDTTYVAQIVESVMGTFKVPSID